MALELRIPMYRATVIFTKSEKDFKKIIKKYGLPNAPFVEPGAAATTRQISHPNGGEHLVLVAIDKKQVNKNYAREVIPHEVAHVTSCIWGFMKEPNIGEEANAYLTGWLNKEASAYYANSKQQ